MGRARSEPWIRLAKVIAMLQARSRKFEQLQVNVKSGEAVPGQIVGRLEGGFSVELEIGGGLPARPVAGRRGRGFLSRAGGASSRSKRSTPVKLVVIVKRVVGKTPWRTSFGKTNDDISVEDFVYRRIRKALSQ